MNMGLLHEVERFSILSQATMVSNIYPIRDAPLDPNEFVVDAMTG
jgi:peptidoglycan biosynthesis protein MviN/MurJ (putative lipid II flippase)